MVVHPDYSASSKSTDIRLIKVTPTSRDGGLVLRGGGREEAGASFWGICGLWRNFLTPLPPWATRGGGGLVCNGCMFGIISWGHSCASPGYPGIYTAMANFQKWIYRTIFQT
uniref:Peptidase S1 domain-containing protein n=1 Tax=Laticauda laticaudata TaxID=8630 RepID=A0A8C5RPX9_LATLA